MEDKAHIFQILKDRSGEVEDSRGGDSRGGERERGRR